MQNLSPETRFLIALAGAAETRLGAAHPLTAAARAAQEGGDPAGAARAHEALAALSEELRDQLLAATHRKMREDIAAIWGLLPGAAQSGGMQ